MTHGRWPTGIGLLAIIGVFVPREFFFVDLPEAVRIAWGVAPWRWSWVALLRLAIQACGLLLGMWGAGRRIRAMWRGFAREKEFSAAKTVALGVAGVSTLILGLGLTGLVQRILL